MPVDEERKKFVDFGNAYHILQSTYLVAPGRKDCHGRSRQYRRRAHRRRRQYRDASATPTRPRRTPPMSPSTKPTDAVAALRDGKVDAIAFSRESLTGLQAKVPGSRILDGGFMNSTTSVALPKGKPAALVYVSRVHRGGQSLRPGAQGLRRDGPDVVAGRPGRDEVLRAASGVADVLGPHAERQHAARNAPQQRPLQHLDQQRRLRPLAVPCSAGPIRLFCSVICTRCVKRVGNSRRCCTALSVSDRHRAAPQRLGQDIGRGHRVLHREIDADAADRRHRVRRIADADQARLVPAPQAGRPPPSAASRRPSF